jgi:hypothetical protein
MVNWSTLKATGTGYLPNEKAKSRLERNEDVETDIEWLNLPQNLYGTLLRILRDGWWLGNLKIDQNSSVREPYIEGRQDEEQEGVGELHQSERRGIQGMKCADLKWFEKRCLGNVRVVFMCSRLRGSRHEGGKSAKIFSRIWGKRVVVKRYQKVFFGSQNLSAANLRIMRFFERMRG